MNLKNSFLGFTDDKKPMQKAKIEDALDKLLRYDGVVMSRKDFIFDRLLKGCSPECAEDVVRYSQRTGEPLAPKTEYRLLHSGGSLFNEISKTEYDFANYLLNNGLVSEDAAEAFISAENERILAEQRAREEAEQNARIAEENERKAAEDFEVWLVEQAAAYENQRKIQLQREIYLDITGSYRDKVIELLVLIDNIDNPRCREKLISWLWYANKASKKTFECVTGIKLPYADKSTKAILEKVTSADYIGIMDYKPRKKAEPVQQEVFYISKSGSFEEVMAEPFSKYGLEMFIAKRKKQYGISEARSGALITTGKTKQEAIGNLRLFVEKKTVEGIKSEINSLVEKYGISPRYEKST